MWGKRREAQQANPAPQTNAPPASLDLPAPERDSGADAGADLTHVTKGAPQMTMDARPAGPLPEKAKQDDASSAGGERAQQFLRSKQLSAAFGDIVSLLSKSPAHKHYALADLEWLVAAPLALNQYLLAEAKLQDDRSAPVAMLFWARLSPELDARLTEAPRYPIRLNPNEWRSGESLWIVDAAGDARVVKGLIETLSKTAFEGKPFKMLTAPRRAQAASAQQNPQT